MLSEAILTIVRLSMDGQKPFSYKDDSNHKTVYMIDGEPVDVYDVIKEQTRVIDLESFMEMVLDYQTDSSDVVTVKVARDEVGVAVDLWATRQTTLKIAETEAWVAINTVGQTKLTQRAFIDWIRHKMHGTGLNSLIPALREIQWSQNAETAGTFLRGRESLGKSVDAAIANFDKFPETVAIVVSRFPEYTELMLPVRLELHIEALPAEQCFSIWVNSDDIENAAVATQRNIRNVIRERWSEIAESYEQSADAIRVLLC